MSVLANLEEGKKILLFGIIRFLILGFFFLTCVYIYMPVMAWGFFSFAVIMIVFFAIIIIQFPIVAFIKKTGKVPMPSKYSEDIVREDVRKYKGVAIGGVIFIFLLIPFFSSFSFFQANAYRDMLGEVKEGTFSKDISLISTTQIRVVDQEMARKVGEKLIGSNLALGSRAELGEFNIQLVNDKLYWIAPVVHSGFWKWRKFDFTPGYVKVAANNPRDAKFITEVKGKDIKIRYQPQAFFNQDLERRLYFNGYMTKGLTDYSFEVNEQGIPFWVVTVYKKSIGFYGNKVLGVVLVNPDSGKISKLYPPGYVPSWVDRVQPGSFIVDQINDWGMYVKGWLNQSIIGSKEGILQASIIENRDINTYKRLSMSLVYGKDGNSYWYTGLTSIGSDNSLVGFMLVNTRNKETRFYKISGATENKARKSAEGKVQEKRYVASTSTILYNIANTPTFLVLLKDNEGLVKEIAFVSLKDYAIVGIGETVRDALRSYHSKLATRTGLSLSDKKALLTTLKTRVKRITQVTKGNTIYYFFLLKGSDKLFVAPSNLSSEVMMTRDGDKIKIQFLKGGSEAITDVISFDNLAFSIKKQ